LLFFINMRKEIFQRIEIPEDVEIDINGSTMIVKGKEGENKRTFNLRGLVFEKEGNKILIGHKKSTKKEKKMINTIAAHIRNMIKGVQKKFEYKLKVVFSHFPITVEVKGHDVLIKNFLGEKTPRKTNVPQGVYVKVDKEMITIDSTDKELAGKAAANFETATRIRNRDRRIFQDGIFITNKAGREI
jgi:large subunit ribosomal protein L6